MSEVSVTFEPESVTTEALAQLGRRDEAEAVRLDSLRWARYGLGDSDAALAREQLQLATRLAEHQN